MHTGSFMLILFIILTASVALNKKPIVSNMPSKRRAKTKRISSTRTSSDGGVATAHKRAHEATKASIHAVLPPSLRASVHIADDSMKRKLNTMMHKAVAGQGADDDDDKSDIISMDVLKYHLEGMFDCMVADVKSTMTKSKEEWARIRDEAAQLAVGRIIARHAAKQPVRPLHFEAIMQWHVWNMVTPTTMGADMHTIKDKIDWSKHEDDPWWPVETVVDDDQWVWVYMLACTAKAGTTRREQFSSVLVQASNLMNASGTLAWRMCMHSAQQLIKSMHFDPPLDIDAESLEDTYEWVSTSFPMQFVFRTMHTMFRFSRKVDFTPESLASVMRRVLIAMALKNGHVLVEEEEPLKQKHEIRSVWDDLTTDDDVILDMIHRHMELSSVDETISTLKRMTFTDEALDRTFSPLPDGRDEFYCYEELRREHHWPASPKACNLLVGMLQRARGNSWFQKATAAKVCKCDDDDA
jgi:hypothetical protein